MPDHIPPRMTRLRDFTGLAVSAALCLAVAALGGLATATSVGDWYVQLAKPGFTPPNAVFGPAWTTLYALMAIASWRVWRRQGLRKARAALGVYALQLALNLLWSVLFFGLQRIGAALVDIVLLVAAAALTLRLFWRADAVAGALLVPYLLWLGFATLLNAAIWYLN